MLNLQRNFKNSIETSSNDPTRNELAFQILLFHWYLIMIRRKWSFIEEHDFGRHAMLSWKANQKTEKAPMIAKLLLVWLNILIICLETPPSHCGKQVYTVTKSLYSPWSQHSSKLLFSWIDFGHLLTSNISSWDQLICVDKICLSVFDNLSSTLGKPPCFLHFRFFKVKFPLLKILNQIQALWL